MVNWPFYQGTVSFFVICDSFGLKSVCLIQAYVNRYCIFHKLWQPCMCWVTQSRLTLCNLDYSPPGSSVHGVFLARILEWVSIYSSKGSSWPEIKPVAPTSPALQADSFLLSHWINPRATLCWKIYWHHFSNSCSLHVSLSHFGNSHSTWNIFTIIVYGHQWLLMLLL